MRHRVVPLLGIASLLLAELVIAAAYTPKHGRGRCAFRGHCGKKSLFSKELPCVDNGLAQEPDDELRRELVDLCGAEWSRGPVCCSLDQVKALKSELGTPNALIGSCPACKHNFFNLFCTFTCSPDQSTFVNVTGSVEKDGKRHVTELDQLVTEEYGSGFYNSCKEVKFGGANSRAMDLIGGGAKNYHEMLKFLGDEKPFVDSPFQINFPSASSRPGMSALEMHPKKCDDVDPDYRCICVDCPEVCPKLPPIEKHGSCRVGALPCLSFASIFTYSVIFSP